MRRAVCRFIVGVLSVGWLLSGQPSYATGSSDCDLLNYQACMLTACRGGCEGPLGETPACKPPPYRPCICDFLTYVQLPTTVIYTFPESVYSRQADAGFAATDTVLGNYVVLSLNPQWVLSFGYGIRSVSMFPWSSRLSAGTSANDTSWLENPEKGHINILPAIGTTAPRRTPTGVEDRLFATSHELFYRAAKKAGASSSSVFSYSPYASLCYPVTKSSITSLSATAANPKTYQGLESFLNRFETPVSTIKSQLQSKVQSSSGFFDGSCQNEVVDFDARPVYFVYEAFFGDIFKNQVDSCQ